MSDLLIYPCLIRSDTFGPTLHNADTLSSLRQLTDREVIKVRERFAGREGATDEHERSRLRFHQVLHVMKVRNGPTIMAAFRCTSPMASTGIRSLGIRGAMTAACCVTLPGGK